MIVSLFVFGLVIGSFLNAFIYRMEIGGSVLRGRSFCPHCKHMLSVLDLIPLVSFVLLRGKCRYCAKAISWQYPLVELGVGAFFALAFFLQGEDIVRLLFTLFIGSSLLVIFVYDLKHYLIPDVIIYAAGVVTVLFLGYQYFLVEQSILPFLLSGVGASAFFLSIFLLSKGKAMGFGDVKLAFLMGLVLGFPDIVVALAIAFLLGSIIGLVLIALQKKTLKAEVPFGPFLVIGMLLAWFWGDYLLSFYTSLVMIY